MRWTPRSSFSIWYVIHLEIVTRFTRDRFDMCSQKLSAVVLKRPLDIPLITQHASTDRNCLLVRAFKALCLRSRRFDPEIDLKSATAVEAAAHGVGALCLFYIFQFSQNGLGWNTVGRWKESLIMVLYSHCDQRRFQCTERASERLVKRSEQQFNTLRRNTLHRLPQLFFLMDQNNLGASRFMNGLFARDPRGTLMGKPSSGNKSWHLC